MSGSGFCCPLPLQYTPLRLKSKTQQDYRALFEDALELIEQVVGFVCRRRGILGDEAEDFRSFVHLRLIENDYAALRKFKGKSTLKTYLVTVVNRLGLDYRIKKWGKWRPSTAAVKLGPAAIELDRLLNRDGIPLSEAIETLHMKGRAERERLEDLAASLPARIKPRFEGEEELAGLVSECLPPDQVLEQKRNRQASSRLVQRLAKALEGFEPEDRNIIRMRFYEGFQIATIADSLGLERKPLYRRIQKLLGQLRDQLTTPEGP